MRRTKRKDEGIAEEDGKRSWWPRLRRTASVDRRLREQDRQLASVSAASRKRRHEAKDVYNAIGFESMWEDGISEVEQGLFSETLSFSDISYQSARKEVREAIFSTWCQLFDSFGADSAVQLSIVNTALPADEIGSRLFFDESDPICGRFAAEYNQILNDKMREGVSNLVRSRFLSFAVGAKDVETAALRLARLRSDVMQTLQRMHCEVIRLDGKKRLQAINDLLRPGKKTEIKWELLGPGSGLRAKDLICPSCIETKPEGSSTKIRIDGIWCQTLVFRSFGSELSDRCIADIIDLPLPLAIVLHIRGIDKTKAISFVSQRLAWMDKEIIDEQRLALKRGYDYTILPSELKHSKTEAEDLLDHLQNKNQRLFRFTGLIYTYAASEAALDDQVLQIKRVARACSIDLDSLDLRQREGLNSILPLANNHIEVGRFMTTAQVAIQMPFATQELSQPTGGYYGQNKESSNLVICDRKSLASPMGYVAGKPGSGKSFAVKREIENTILSHPKDQVIVFDPAGEYASVILPNGGSSIRLGSDSNSHLNPFDLTDVGGLSPATQLAFKIDALLALSGATMAEGDQGLPEADKSIIARCVEIAYESCSAKATPPVLSDFYEALTAQREPEARDIALRYERYVRGATSFFNHTSNVSFDGRLTNIDLHGLSEHMRTFGMLTALECVRNQMYANFERGITTWLYIDEVQSLFGHPSIISYFSKFWAEGRKFGLICTGITQNSLYMLEHAEARNMILNFDFILLFKQSVLDRKAWAELLGLSEREEAYIDEATRPGEGLLIAGAARIPIKDDFPKGELYNLFDTKPGQTSALRRSYLSQQKQARNKELK